MAQDIPVYLFTGFMDSGKTSLVEETLFENEFGDGAKGVIIMCEDGEKEYDEAKLATINFKLTSIESEEEFTLQKLQEIQDTFQPEQVFIEYNGTWGMDKILEAQMPEGWVIVQSLATVDSTTFDMYMNNMRAMMQEQVFSSDVVIFNRTDDDTDRGHLRRSIKAINRKAQIVYERKDGTIDERPEELPFDINQDVIELSDADYAIWYMDAMENYKKYDRKKVKFRALVYNPDKLKKGVFVPGRFAMTCCIEDVTFIGFKCKYDKEEQRKTIEVTTANADIAKQEREIELKQKQVAVTEKSLEAEVKKKAEADKYAAQQRAEADLYQRQKDAEAKQFEAQRAAEAQKAQAEAMRYAKEQEAAGIRAVGEAEASAIQAKGIAEAEAMEKKAEAYAKYNKAAVAEMMIKVLPDIAGKVAEPLGQIDKITIIGGGEGGSNGVDQIAGNVPVVMAKVFESMKEATGIDLADIINAESYDAKVNRNVNLSGLDSVNFVVKDDGTNVTMGKPQTKVNATAVEASAQGTGTASETTNQ